MADDVLIAADDSVDARLRLIVFVAFPLFNHSTVIKSAELFKRRLILSTRAKENSALPIYNTINVKLKTFRGCRDKVEVYIHGVGRF